MRIIAQLPAKLGAAVPSVQILLKNPDFREQAKSRFGAPQATLPC
jgi:hypothetical protein